MKKILLFILSVILAAGAMFVDSCEKNDEPVIPTGWQESMSGKILYTRSHNSINSY